MALDSNCTSKQTFCALGKQKVSDHTSLTAAYPDSTNAGEKIKANHYNYLFYLTIY